MNNSVFLQCRAVMRTFNFHKVQTVYNFLNWTWAGEGVPMEDDLRNTAERLLGYVEQSFTDDPERTHISYATGGLRAELTRVQAEDGTLCEPRVALMFECETARFI